MVAEGPGWVEVRLKPDPVSGANQWFHLKIVGSPPGGGRLRIRDADRCTFPRGWEGFAAAVSTDGTEWSRAVTRYDMGVVEVDVPEGDCVVASFAPFSLARHRALVARLSEVPGRVRVLGQTLDGEALHGVELGAKDGVPVWVIARQHAGEAMAEWFAAGLLQRLTDPDDPVAAALLGVARVRVVPNMNPDGTRRGHLRGNALGTDLNRAWLDPDPAVAPEVACVLAEMDRSGVAVCLDVHGDEVLPVAFGAGAEGTPSWSDARAARATRFEERWVAATGDYQTAIGYPTTAPGTANMRICTNQVSERFGAMALTVEQPFKGWSPLRSVALGRSVLQPLCALLVGCGTGSVVLPEPDAPSVDVAAAAGAQDWEVAGRLQKGRGCTVVDLDLDGRQDLILSNPADTSYVLRNVSSPGLVRFEPGPILDGAALVWTISAADLDGDGDPDLFAALGGLEGRQRDVLLRNDWVETGLLGFTDITEAAGVSGPWRTDPELQILSASLAGHWVDFDQDADLDLWVDATHWPAPWGPPTQGQILGRNQLWRNDGGVFTDVVVAQGLDHRASTRFSSWLDIDGDGDLDLYENVMTPSEARLWRHEADHSFTDATAGAALLGGNLAMPPETFVSTAADFNNDGYDDLLVFVRGLPSAGPHQRGHTLFLNHGGQGFVDVTEAANLNDPFLSGLRDHVANGVMGATARDLNGDGLPDVFVGNGGPSAGFHNALYLSTGLQQVDLGGGLGTIAVPTFENRSDLIDIPAKAPEAVSFLWPAYPYRTHAGCVADFDGDGRPELYIANGGMSLVGGEAAREPNRLFQFDLGTAPRWLSVALRGDGVTVPFTPVGARIAATVAAADRTWVVRDTLRTVEGFAAQHGLRRWLGLGDAERVVELRITWPDGTATVRRDVALDSNVEIARSDR